MTTVTSFKDITVSNNIGVVIDGNYMYIAAVTAKTITRLNLIDSTFTTNWATTTQGLNTPCGMAISNGYLYCVGVVTNPTICKISLANPTTVYDASWKTTTLGTNYIGLFCVIVDNYLYVGFSSTTNTSGVISKISLTNPAGDYTPNWATISNGGVFAMTYFNGYIYCAVWKKGIYTVNISSPTNITLFTNAIGTVNDIYGLVIHGNYLYVSSHQSNTLSRFSLLSPSTKYTVAYANIPDTTIVNLLTGIGIYNGYIYNSSFSNTLIGRVPITSISKIITIAGDITNTTSTTEIAGLQFNTSTLFNKPVGYIENTKNGHIIFATWDTPSSGGLYIVSTLTNGYAYGINMTVGTIYKLASCVSSGYAPSISAGGVRSAETTYANTKMYGQFLTFTTNANADIYVYDVPDPPNFMNAYLHCIPYSNRMNEFTGISMTAGYVYPIYYFPNWKAATKMVFDPSGNLLLAMTNRNKILPLCASASQTMYGISAQKYTTGAIPDALNISNTYSITTSPTGPMSMCIDQYRNIYYTPYNYTSVIVVCYSPPTIVFNVAISTSTTQINLNIVNTSTTIATCIEFDSSYNLYCTTYEGKLYVLSSSTVTKKIMGIPVSAGYQNRSTAWDVLINNPNSVAVSYGSGNNVNINDSTVVLGGRASLSGVPYFSVDKITGRNLYFAGSYGIRMTVDEITSAPSVITATPLTKTIQQLSNLPTANSYNYTGGGSILRYYYSYDNGGTYSSFSPGNLASYSLSSAIANPETITIIAENIVEYSPPYTASLGYICFKKDSRILTNTGYRKIQHLKKGDSVKTLTHGFVPIYRIGKKDIVHEPTIERSKNHLYKCSTTQYPGLFEDLVLTGCHSILVDDYVDEPQLEKTIQVNGDTYVTDGKYRLPVCADYRASIYETAGKYTVYHIALENDDYYANYGIYANGLLVESTSKRFLSQFPIMET